VKKPNLAEIARAAGSSRRATALPAPSETPAAAPGKARSRAGTRQVAAHFPAEVAWQLRELAVAQRTTVQNLLGEALNDLFQKYGRPEIVPLDRERGN
jgi:antitoxin-like ribbon-helix-helix protein